MNEAEGRDPLRSTMALRLVGPTTTRCSTLRSCTQVLLGRSAPSRTVANIIQCRRLASATTEPLFSAAAAATKTNESSTIAKDKKKDDGNFFLDNLGKIFLGTIGLIIGSLVRSSYGTSNRNKLRDELEERASLDPYEVDDLRVANSELSPDVFRAILKDIQDAFPLGIATYKDFCRSVRKTMCRLKGEAFTVELGHLLDRAVIAALQQQGREEDAEAPLEFLLASLSLALHSSADNRIKVLFEVMEMKDGRVTFKNVQDMVGYLQDTCQLVPDAQVVTAERKYPTQQYKRGTPEQLIKWEGSAHDEVDLDAFTAIIRSKSICAWGECYIRKKRE